MTKIIVVQGVNNSGKTSSIRLFLENNGVFHNHEGDITLVLPIRKNGKTYRLGVTSTGDIERDIEKNFKFFSNHKLDFIICAARSHGKTIKFIEEHSRANGFSLICIAKKRAVPFDHMNIAAEIDSKIS